jgi:hypothetical protein
MNFEELDQEFRSVSEPSRRRLAPLIHVIRLPDLERAERYSPLTGIPGQGAPR